jgi:hypothetical protein
MALYSLCWTKYVFMETLKDDIDGDMANDKAGLGSGAGAILLIGWINPIALSFNLYSL